MAAGRTSWIDWRDAAAYAPLLGADRSLLAWEWLRRDAEYRRASGRPGTEAGKFGLLAFEDPRRPVPLARPMWNARSDPHVLSVVRVQAAQADDVLDLGQFEAMTTIVRGEEQEHLLLCDGLRTLRLDAPHLTFGTGPACFRYRLEGVVSAERGLITLRRLIALCRTGAIRSGPRCSEAQATRQVLLLRTFDALAAGAAQREIAQFLLSPSVSAPRWRAHESSVRSRVQRLVRSARQMGRDERYFSLLR